MNYGEGRPGDYEEIAAITNQLEPNPMDEGRPPTSDDESDEGAHRSPLETQWITHTVDIHIARLVEELIYVEGVHHLAAYLVRREIRRLALERGSIAAVYVEHHGQRATRR
jgi:hypothetical protein